MQGNLIGTNATGTAAVPNATGINIRTASNTIGGATSGAGNVISGNTIGGIIITDAAGAQNTVQGNRIGTDARIRISR